MNQELLSKALLEPAPDNLPSGNLPPEDLPPELLQLIFSNLPPQSLKYDSPFNACNICLQLLPIQLFTLSYSSSRIML